MEAEAFLITTFIVYDTNRIRDWKCSLLYTYQLPIPPFRNTASPKNGGIGSDNCTYQLPEHTLRVDSIVSHKLLQCLYPACNHIVPGYPEPTPYCSTLERRGVRGSVQGSALWGFWGVALWGFWGVALWGFWGVALRGFWGVAPWGFGAVPGTGELPHGGSGELLHGGSGQFLHGGPGQCPMGFWGVAPWGFWGVAP